MPETVSLAIAGGSDNVMASHHIFDLLERVLVDEVWIDVEDGGSGKKPEAVMKDEERTIGAAGDDHGRVAHALLKKA